MTSDPPFLSRRRFATVGALTVLAGCSGEGTTAESSPNDSDENNQQSPADTPADTTTPEGESEDTGQEQQSQSANVAIGELVEGDNLSMVVREISETQSLGEFQEAGSGNTFVVVRMAAKNTSGDFINFNSFLQARLKDSENTVYDASFSFTEHPIQNGILAAGEVARGDVVFEVPEDAEGLEMQFDFTTFDLFKFDRVTVNLEEEADSIADLDQSLQVDILSEGDEAGHNDVTVILHGVRTANELGEFTQSDDGHEYVIPDFEITNETGEELHVSTLLQMRVKTGDGLAYMADIGGSSQLDKGYSEGSPVAAGESRRGELAYQVSEDASPLYWVFDYIDIGGGYKAFWEIQ